MVRRFASMLASLVVTLSAVPEDTRAAVDAEWKRLCREAYHLQRLEKFMDAWSKYDLALKELGRKKPIASNEIKLDMASMLILAGDYGKAQRALDSLLPIFSKDRDSMQSIRYWRRCRELHRLTKEFDRAISDQRNVLEIAKTNFDPLSQWYLDEKLKLLDLFTSSSRFDEAALIAMQLKNVLPELSTEGKNRYTRSINQFMAQVAVASCAEVDRGNFKQAVAVLQHVKALNMAPLAYLEQLDYARKVCEKRRPGESFELQYQVISEARKLPHEPKAITAEIEALAFLADYKYRNERFDGELETWLRRLNRLTKQIYPESTLNKEGRSVIVRCMLARTLAARGKVKEAEEVVDTVKPDGNVFKTDDVFMPVYQARIFGIAEALVKTGDKQGIERQFKIMREQYSSMPLIPNKERWLQIWKGEEAKYLSRAGARS